jgi:hypothetical protein
MVIWLYLTLILVMYLRRILDGKVEIIFNKSQGLPMTHQFFGVHVRSVHLAELVIPHLRTRYTASTSVH